MDDLFSSTQTIRNTNKIFKITDGRQLEKTARTKATLFVAINESSFLPCCCPGSRPSSSGDDWYSMQKTHISISRRLMLRPGLIMAQARRWWRSNDKERLSSCRDTVMTNKRLILRVQVRRIHTLIYPLLIFKKSPLLRAASDEYEMKRE